MSLTSTLPLAKLHAQVTVGLDEPLTSLETQRGARIKLQGQWQGSIQQPTLWPRS